jgi:acetyl esterase/lipase
MDNFVLPPEMNTSQIKRKWLNRQYANQSPTQKLDIYLPDAGNGPFPVIASIHGGAWMIGDKGDMQNSSMMEGLKHGYAVACINYRLSGEAQFPCQIYDCKAAIRYLRANASAYYLDANRIAAWGSCLGGNSFQGSEARGFFNGESQSFQ